MLENFIKLKKKKKKKKNLNYKKKFNQNFKNIQFFFSKFKIFIKFHRILKKKSK